MFSLTKPCVQKNSPTPISTEPFHHMRKSHWVRRTLYSVAVSLPSKWTSGPTQPFPLHLPACGLHFFWFRNLKKFIWNAWVPDVDAPCSSWPDVHLLWEQLLGVRTTTPFKDNLQNRKWAHNKFALGRGSSVQLTSWSRLQNIPLSGLWGLQGTGIVSALCSAGHSHWNTRACACACFLKMLTYCWPL